MKHYKIKHFRVLLLAVTIGLGGVALGQKPPKLNNLLPNFQKVDDRLLRGAQPSPAGILALKEMRVATVISLRSDSKRVAAEKQLVEAAGMRFVNIPLNDWRRPKDTEIDRIMQLIDHAQNQPVFIHCERGADRTGTVAAIYRIKYSGWTAGQALTEAKSHHLGWWQFWMKDYINDYYRDFRLKSEKPVTNPPGRH